jgi:hypothetical protein
MFINLYINILNFFSHTANLSKIIEDHACLQGSLH